MNQNNIKPQELRATDLRIGNWVWNEVQQVPVQVDIKILQEQINAFKGIGQYWQPIPLSEEVLLKAGFEKRVNSMQIDGIEMRLQVSGCEPDGTWFSSCGKLGGGLVVLVICRGNYVCNNIEYLHQLQNLFYSLTQTELEISWT